MRGRLTRIANAVFNRSEPGISLKQIEPFLPARPVIVEAGAATGSDTVAMARRWPQGTIHAFEPLEVSYASVVDATRAFPNVNTYQLALGDANEQREMWV